MTTCVAGHMRILPVRVGRGIAFVPEARSIAKWFDFDSTMSTMTEYALQSCPGMILLRKKFLLALTWVDSFT